MMGEDAAADETGEEEKGRKRPGRKKTEEKESPSSLNSTGDESSISLLKNTKNKARSSERRKIIV